MMLKGRWFFACVIRVHLVPTRKLCGYLRHRERNAFLQWEWHRRWCVLAGCLFLVFEDASEAATSVLWVCDLSSAGSKEVIQSNVRPAGRCCARACW